MFCVISVLCSRLCVVLLWTVNSVLSWCCFLCVVLMLWSWCCLDVNLSQCVLRLWCLCAASVLMCRCLVCVVSCAWPPPCLIAACVAWLKRTEEDSYQPPACWSSRAEQKAERARSHIALTRPPAARPFSFPFISLLHFFSFFLLILGNNFSLFFYPMRTPILSSFKGGKISNGICVFIFPSCLIFVFELHGVEIIVFYICFSHLFFFSSAC